METTGISGGGNATNAATYHSFPQLSRLLFAPDGADGAGAGGGGGAAAEGAAQIGEFKVPEGKALLDIAEVERYKQNSERVRGMQPYWEAGSRYGIKKPEDFEPIGRLYGTLKSRNMTPDQIIKLMEGEAEQDQSVPDIAALEKKFGENYIPKDKFESELNRRDALYEHRSAVKLEQELVAKATASLLGDNPSPREKFLIERAMRAEFSDPKNRRLYDQNHALHKEEIMPLDEKGVNSIVEMVKKELGIADGAELEKIGKAAAKGTTTPAGAPSPLGKAKQEDDPNTTMSERIARAIKKAES